MSRSAVDYLSQRHVRRGRDPVPISGAEHHALDRVADVRAGRRHAHPSRQLSRGSDECIATSWILFYGAKQPYTPAGQFSLRIATSRRLNCFTARG